MTQKSIAEQIGALWPRLEGKEMSSEEFSKLADSIPQTPLSRFSTRGQTLDQLKAVTGLSTEDATDLRMLFQSLKS